MKFKSINNKKIKIFDKLKKFSTRRVFLIEMNKDDVRGNHGHKKHNQILLLFSGKIEIYYFNTKINKIEKKKFSKVKSLNNGQEFCLTQTPKTNFINPETGYLTGGYMINLNDGCLSVGASDYKVYKCNDENQKHLFKIKHIINEQDYENNIDKTVPFDNIDKTKINYPFALIKSVNNNNCLTNKNGNITVQPCNSFVAQRWIPL